MKLSIFDRVLSTLSPSLAVKRIQSKMQLDAISRVYDAAKTYSTDDWTSATDGSANSEIGPALASLRNKGSDAARNNEYGARILQAIVNNTIGAGIVPHIQGKTEQQTKLIQDAWKNWGETTFCDAAGKLNYYSMQALAFRNVVERGEILVENVVTPKIGCSLRLLESDFIDTSKPTTPTQRQGIILSPDGRVVGYHLFPAHPGDSLAQATSNPVDAERINHVFRMDRPGQLRGVSWFAPVIRKLEDLNQYQQSTLISRKISSLFTAFITSNDNQAYIDNTKLAEKRARDANLTPGSLNYLQPGENVQFGSPPKLDGYSEYVVQVLRSISSGMGASYEAITNDYSQVNYSSGRMGNLEFKKNVNSWQWNMFIPQFCEPTFKHFLVHCEFVLGLDVSGVSCEWIVPTWEMLDPLKEIGAMKQRLRNGLISYPRAIRELGNDPDTIIKEIAESNAILDQYNLILDIDPRKTSDSGLSQQAYQNSSQQGDNNNAQ